MLCRCYLVDEEETEFVKLEEKTDFQGKTLTAEFCTEIANEVKIRWLFLIMRQILAYRIDFQRELWYSDCKQKIP